MGYDVIKTIAKSKGIALEHIATNAGITYNSLSKIIRNAVKEPRYSTIKSIADTLGITTDQLLIEAGLLNVQTNRISFSITEQEHIKKYRALDTHGKKMVDLVITEESARMDNIANETADATIDTIIRIQYELPVSAGSGVYLGDDADTFEVELIDNIYTRSADYILRVSGRSMEPKFTRGDLLLVKSQPDVDFGEIGIWVIDNNGYVKKKGEDRLISINPDVDDIYLNNDNDYRCVGRVIGKIDPDWILDGGV